MKKKYDFTCLLYDGEVVKITIAAKSKEHAIEKFNKDTYVKNVIEVKERQPVKLHVWNEDAFKQELMGLHI